LARRQQFEFRMDRLTALVGVEAVALKKKRGLAPILEHWFFS
jgi:hypothetical protein